MTWPADTNVLLRSVQTAHPMYADVSRALNLIFNRGDDIHITGQNLVEFWAVATRQVSENGLGLELTDAATELAKLKTTFALLDDTPHTLPRWEELVIKHQVKGKQAHDARLVAAMLVHGVTRLLTFNVADFQRYNEIIVVNPQDISEDE